MQVFIVTMRDATDQVIDSVWNTEYNAKLRAATMLEEWEELHSKRWGSDFHEVFAIVIAEVQTHQED